MGLAEHAIAAAVASGLDFGLFDSDNDGYVDALTIVHAGLGAERSGLASDIWSHYQRFDRKNARDLPTGSTNAAGNPVFVRDFTVQPEYFFSPGDMTIGVFAHEFAHVLGMPDLYDAGVKDDTRTRGLGNWSLMAGGNWNGANGDLPAHPDAWTRIKLGWVKPSFPSGNTSIPDIKTSQTVLRVPKVCTDQGGDEYFLLEHRKATQFDAGLPGEGLLIYHVDDSIESNEYEWYPGCTTCTKHYKVALEQADGNWDLEQNISPGDPGDPYPGSSGNSAFSNKSTPDSKNYAGVATGVKITRIKESGQNINAAIRSSNSSLFKPFNLHETVVSPNPLFSVSFGDTNYLSAWDEGNNVKAARVDTCGHLLDGSPISVTNTAPGEGVSNASEAAFDGQRYLVIWHTDFFLNGLDGIRGKFISPTGSTGTEFVIRKTDGIGILGQPDIVFNGLTYMVSWYEFGSSGGAISPAVRVAIVNRKGTILATKTIATPPPGVTNLCCTSIAGHGDRIMIVWDTWAASGAEAHSISGALLDASGSVLNTFTVDSGHSTANPNVAYNQETDRFLVSWVNQSGLETIDGRIYDSQGNAQTNVFTISGSGEGPNENWPQSAPNGQNFVTTWTSFGRKSVVREAVIDSLGNVASRSVIQSGNVFSSAIAYDNANNLLIWLSEKRGDFTLKASFRSP